MRKKIYFIIFLVTLIMIAIAKIYIYLQIENNSIQVELLSKIYADTIEKVNDDYINIRVDKSAFINFITHKEFCEEDVKKLNTIITSRNIENNSNISQFKVIYNNNILTITITSFPSADVINQESFSYMIIPKFSNIEYKKID